MRPRSLALVAGVLLAAGGIALGAFLAAGHDGRPVHANFQVALTANIDPSQNPAEDARIEARTPVPPAIYVIPRDMGSNVPFPPSLMGATSYFSESNGHLERDIYAGRAGCGYGRYDSCSPNGNKGYKRIGMIFDTVTNHDGIDPPSPPPTLVPGTGLLTFTGFAGGTIFFKTESGHVGSYSMTTGRATLEVR